MAPRAAQDRKTTTAPDDVDSQAVAEEVAAASDVDLEDLEPASAEVARRGDDEGEGDRARKPKNLEYEPDAREALNKTFQKARATQGRDLTTDAEDDAAEEDLEDGIDPDDDDAEVRIVAGAGAREVNQPVVEAKPRKVVDLEDDDIVVAVVDGEKVEMTFKEMKSRAQKDAATDNRLQSANALLDEMRAIASGTKPVPAVSPDQGRTGDRSVDRQADDAPASKSGQTRADLQAKLVKVIDEVQTDSPEKAAEALAEVLSEFIAPGQTNAADVQAEVAQAIATHDIETRAKGELSVALSHVSETYGDLLNDEYLGEVAYSQALKEVVIQLRAIGVPDEDFRVPPNEIFAGYAKLRQDPTYGEKLKPMKDLFDETAKAVRQRFPGDGSRPAVNGKAEGNGTRPNASGQPARIVRSTERSERKGGLSVQPRSASVRSDFTGHNRTVRKDLSKTVADMAEARKS